MFICYIYLFVDIYYVILSVVYISVVVNIKVLMCFYVFHHKNYKFKKFKTLWIFFYTIK